MRYLWDDLDKITRLINSHPTRILLFDFDGTLASIVKTYQHAILSSQTRRLLQDLTSKKGGYLVIISGRTLTDLKNKVKIPSIIYGGIHGLTGEIYGKKFTYPIPPEQSLALDEIRQKLKNLTNQFYGTFLEDKTIALAFHFRQAKKDLKKIKLLFSQIIHPYLQAKLISVIKGKKVLDVRPGIEWNKGSFAKLAVKQINQIAHVNPLAIYLGDDQTDEDAFESLQDQITIRVGKHNKSKAKYFLKNPREVVKFLRLLNTML